MSVAVWPEVLLIPVICSSALGSLRACAALFMVLMAVMLVQVSELEVAKDMLIQRSESILNIPSLQNSERSSGGVVDAINSGIAGAEQVDRSV